MTSNKLIHNIKEVVYVVVIWVLLTFFYVYVKFNDVPDEYLSEIFDFPAGMSKSKLYQVSFFVAMPLGFLLGLLHTFVYPNLDRTKGLLVNILLRALVFLIISVLIFIIISYVYEDERETVFSNLSRAFADNPVVNVFVYMLVIENLVTVFILLRRNLGGNYFLNTITNTYRNPKEENRVFMFLDMEDSTPTAAKMGHLNFSSYIQNCFLDLSDVVLKYGGEIYQFVGDEAVITWKVSGKFNYFNCVELYFSYMDELKKKENFYLRRHNTRPVFRCAIHSGMVSTALVGDYKKEIAYHGDALNFCSRLQSVCKVNNAYVLASEEFCRNILVQNIYTLEAVFLPNLKGIEKDKTAYRITRK